jgi:hypothetical protein
VDSAGFYEGIPLFSNFAEFTEDRHYQSVPRDWHVVLTDVKGSTKAIEAGRYKDVNRVGAAAIVCAQQGMGGRELPYVFGGDGATFLVPPGFLDGVCSRLASLKALSERAFGLGLRVGVIGVAEVLEGGAKIELARFELAGGRSIAIFRGGGLTAAEAKIKGDEARYGLNAAPLGEADLDELSCRWSAVPASRGVSVSLLVQARGGDAPQVYQRVLAGLNEVIEHGLEAANPIQRSSMSYRGWWECVSDEARYFPSRFSGAFLKKVVGISVAVASFRWKIPPFFFDPKSYSDSIPAHCDYRKFDDTLRMIIDCSPAQAAELRDFLEGLRAEGLVFYGVHEASASLMTCYVKSTAPGEHIHFVDGGNGGYAMAAKELKAQIKAAL